MATITEIDPLSTNVSQTYPANERRIQPYQQPTNYQAWSTENSQDPLVTKSTPKESESGSCKKYLTSQLAMSIFVGLVICGIPLAVMSALYAQKKASPNTDSGTGSSDDSASLPIQCSTYMTNADSTRLTTFTGCTTCMYDTSSYFTAGWYRFIDTAGTRLATTPPNSGSCGASYPAWYNGTFPSTVGSTIISTVCAQVNGNLCSSSYPMTAYVTNCSSFYVFYLTPTTITSIRYCTTF